MLRWIQRWTVLTVAAEVEPDLDRRRSWYTDVPIRHFGDRTAEQVVASGETRRLVSLLREISQAERHSH